MSFARAIRRAPFVLLLSLLAPALAACSGGGGDAKAADAKAQLPTSTSVNLKIGGVGVEATGTPGVLADKDQDAIVNTVRRYIVAATMDPLHGKPIGDLAAIFTAPAVTALAGLDRVATLDEGVPKATSVKVRSAPMLLSALSDPAGAINLVGTSLYVDVRATTKNGPVRVQRSGQLVLSRDLDTWKIASFKLSADRSGSGLGTATTSSTTVAPS